MKTMISPSLLLRALLVLLLGVLSVQCGENRDSKPAKLTIGVVSYDEGMVSLDKYERFKNYIALRTKSIVELEPAYNELQATEQIRRKRWDIVFAPPGLAAIAMSTELYVPIFSMGEISSRQRSLLVVRDDQPIKKISDLGNKTVAFGEIGSAAGYYVPLYDLYGLTLAQIRFAPTPKTILQWLSEGSVNAGALSEKDFELYQREFSQTKFRILHISRWIPPGLVLVGPSIESNRQHLIQKVMGEASGNITTDAGYVPNAQIPNYQQFIQLVEKVKPLEDRVKQTPAVLIIQASTEQKKVGRQAVK